MPQIIRDRLKLIISVIVVIIFCGLGYYFYESSINASDDPTKPHGNLVTFDGSTIKEEENGKLVWELTAKKIELNPKTREVYLTDLTGKFFKDGVVTTVTAPRGHVSGDKSTIQISGGVKAENNKGASASTNGLDYNGKNKQITSTSPFTYTDNGTTISGDKLEGDMALQIIKAVGHAKLSKK